MRVDNAGELSKGEMAAALSARGVQIQRIDPHSPKMNGRVEAKIRDLTVLTRTLLLAARLPPTFWTFALRHAAYLKNVTLTRAVGVSVTPYEMRFGKRPSLSHLRVFGCSAVVHIAPCTDLLAILPVSHCRCLRDGMRFPTL
eukprot:TRINITY_DN409_c0_g3_i1.p2 TRINITY_DN409_c0_g3~~TRINITY_DN409_c0_g3_i1.p2  ORF type:complete len:142 (+),score=23.68 TRINITY_DN409_c0_g3_i1:710-1135(+)